MPPGNGFCCLVLEQLGPAAAQFISSPSQAWQLKAVTVIELTLPVAIICNSNLHFPLALLNLVVCFGYKYFAFLQAVFAGGSLGLRSSPRKIPGSNFLGLLNRRILEALAWKGRPLQFPHSIPAGRPAGPPGPACILLVMGAYYLLGQPMPSFFFFLSLFLKFLRYCFHFMFCFFGLEACESLAPHQGSNPHPLHWKATF